MDALTFAYESRKPVLDHNNDLLKRVLTNSKGAPEMSNEDVKLAILALHGTVTQQTELIEKLYTELSEMKTIIQTLLKK